MIDDLIELEALDNIAEILSEDELAKIGSDVVTGFDNDLSSRETWDAEMSEARDVALQIRKDTSFPWKDASNIKLPLITEAIVHYNSMMYPALIPQTDIVKSRVVGEDANGEKEKAAIRVSKHMSYQVLEEMEEWEEEMDLGLIVQGLLGNMYKKSYHEGRLGRNKSEMLTPDEFVVDYWTKNIKDCYRKTHVLPYTRNDINKRIAQGIYSDVDIGEPVVEEKKKKGENPPEADKSTPFKVLEQHTYLDLDDDEIEEPYIITVEYKTKKVLRIVAGYEAKDILYDDDGKIIDVPQYQYFTKYGFIPNPDGSFMDIGLGKLLTPTNEAASTLINQMINAGTLSTTTMGFLGRGIKARGGKIKARMGEFIRLDSTGDDMRKNIVPFDAKGPSVVLFNLLSFLVNQAQRLASTMDSQVGENPGQNQKATTSSIVQENGLKIFNGIYKRNHRSLKQELRKLFKLNGSFLPAESYLNVLDPNVPAEIGKTIHKTDYSSEMVNIIPAADSAYTPQHIKMMKSRSLLEKIGTGLVNPQEVMKRALESEEHANVEALMNVPKRGPSIDELEFHHGKAMDIARLNLDRLKSQRDDIKVRADAIRALAQAEAAENGTQLSAYKLQLEGIVKESEELNRQFEKQSSLANGNEGMGNMPPAKQFLSALLDEYSEIGEDLVAGVYTTESAEGTAQLYAKAIGRGESIQDVIELLEDFGKTDEDEVIEE